MNRTLTKSIVVLVALVLCASCIGSAFAVYTKGDSKTINISAFVPDNYYVKGSWNNWTADASSKMTYSNGVYVINDVSVAAWLKFQVFKPEDTWYGYSNLVTVDNTSYQDNSGDIQFKIGGVYDITFDPSSGISLSRDTTYYTFHLPTSLIDHANNDLYFYYWRGDENHWGLCDCYSYDASIVCYVIEDPGDSYDGWLLVKKNKGSESGWNNVDKQTVDMTFESSKFAYISDWKH